jgi:sarcosine oxidase, subunit beta
MTDPVAPTPTHAECDVVVVGAGVVGSSCAFHLAERGLDVRVIERFAGPAEGSSGKSFASVRAQWTDPLNIDLSWRSIQAYRAFERTYGIDIGYRPTGYLFLVPEQAWERHLRAVELQRSFGVPVAVLSLAEAQRRTPFVEDGLAGGLWGEADGVVDPQSVAQAYLDLARRHGATVHFRRPAEGVERLDGGWRITARDLVVEAPIVVNAGGGWGREVAALAGLEVPVDHVRRTIYSSAALPEPVARPMTIDVSSGFYLRSEGDRILFSMVNPAEPLGYSDRVDWSWLETVLDTGSRRFPWLADLPLDQAGAWAGTYEITADNLPVLGRHPGADGWVDACGFSGHGVIQAPETGRLVAEEVIDGSIHSVDVTALRIARFADASASSPEFVF